MNMRHTLIQLTKTVLATSFSFVVVALLVSPVWAVGTGAGTVISNTATLNYSLFGTPVAPVSDTVNFTVDEIIDVVVTWQDGANVPVVSPDTDRVLTFLVTNIGNGSEDFSLVVDNAIAGDQFDPANARVYIDNGNGTYDGIATETLYIPGTNEPTLDANGVDAVTIFVLNDIPAGFVVTDTGISNLTTSSMTAGAAGAPVGTVLAGLGDGGVDAVVGPTNADGNANGTYEVQSVAVTITKSNSVISDPTGCVVAPCSPIPGAVVRYTLVVNVSGIGTAENLIITDLIPAEMTYNPGTITLDTVAKGDAPFAVDGDEATFALNTVTVDLGNVTAVSSNTITFDVTIN